MGNRSLFAQNVVRFPQGSIGGIQTFASIQRTQGRTHMTAFTRTAAVLGLAAAFFASSAQATITSGTITNGGGTFVKLALPFFSSNPPNTVGNDTFQNVNLYGFDEGQNIVIPTALQVDDLANGLGGGSGPGTLAAGTVVASHYVFFDPKDPTSQKGLVNFDSAILAVITSTNLLAASDFLIQTGVTYLNPSARGLEAGDVVSISGLNQIQVDWAASTPGDYVRVLTAFSPSVPEPSSWAMLAGGVLVLGALRKRR
jgi:PEP-CTERM motif